MWQAPAPAGWDYSPEMVTHEQLFGIGDQVIITQDSADGSRDWAGEPSGEIIAAADDQAWDLVVGEMSAQFPWVVSLDTPQYLKDGTGPFTEATVEAWRLRHAPVGDEGTAAEEGTTAADVAQTQDTTTTA